MIKFASLNYSIENSIDYLQTYMTKKNLKKDIYS